MTTVTAFPEFPDPIRGWADWDPARLAVVARDTDQRLTYGELDREADRWIGRLRGCGVRPGDRVAVLAGNRLELVMLFVAAIRMRTALVPLNWRLAAAELGPILQNARPAVLFGEGRFRALAEESSRALDAAPRWIDLDGPPLPDGEDRGHLAVDAEDPLLVLYTSGSTGRPKGAVLPHRQIFFNAVATATAWELGPADVAPISTPFFHTGGWNVFAVPLWHRGGRVVLFDRFEADDFLAGLQVEQCTVALAVPTQLHMLLGAQDWGRPLPALRSLWVGGAPCPATVGAKVREAGYGLREGYGLTECGPNCFVISAAESARLPGCVGRPMAFLSMRLSRDDGSEADIDEPGELLLRGPQVFSGYLHDPARTAEALTPDGWLRTGDLATRDPAGRYRIWGRRKEMFISGGENVYPAEVEAALADCPGVADVAVVGVPDERWGEVGRAYVVPRIPNGARAAMVLAHARSKLAGYKVPRSVVILPALPRLGSGKVDRAALAETSPGPG